MESISDTLELILHDVVKSGNFERFLQKRGWQQLNPIPEKTSKMRFDVPFEVKRRSANYVNDTKGALC